ncbi:MAG: hypothetical protein ACO3FO_07430 [Candidatus Nanopelagicaceae bacterium]
MKKEYKNELGQYHRLDGPAIENDNGNKYWFIDGKFHREDGPAIERNNDSKSWYLNGIECTEEEFHQEVIKLKLKRLVEL